MVSPSRLADHTFTSPRRVFLFSLIVSMVLFAAASVDLPLRGTPRQAVAQGDTCDSNQCIIWGIDNGVPQNLLQINTCNGTVVAAPFAVGAPLLNSIATVPAGPPYPQLKYGLATGGSVCSAGFPPAGLAPCEPAVAAGMTSLALGDTDPTVTGGGEFFAGGDLPLPGSLYNPTTFIGAGGLNYQMLASDLVCDPTGQWGFMGEADLPGSGPLAASNHVLVQVSRGNGAQTHARPPLGRNDEFSGLAYNGFGQLWGGKNAVVGLWQIDPATGLGVRVWPAVASTWDLASNECSPGCPAGPGVDVGDAPDSTTHAPNQPMTAYPGVSANFPVVRDLSTGAPPGPLHRLIPDSVLGETVTAEAYADQLPDADVVTNIWPLTDTSDRDGADDGVQLPIQLAQCQLAQFSYVMTVVGPVRDRYVNVWFDFDRNGSWGDVLQCSYNGQVCTVTEWAVVDQLTQVGPGVHVMTTPQFRGLDPDDDLWMRITLSETIAPAADGRGYDLGYETGETEDCLLAPIGGGQYQ